MNNIKERNISLYGKVLLQDELVCQEDDINSASEFIEVFKKRIKNAKVNDVEWVSNDYVIVDSSNYLNYLYFWVIILCR